MEQIVEEKQGFIKKTMCKIGGFFKGIGNVYKNNSLFEAGIAVWDNRILYLSV